MEKRIKINVEKLFPSGALKLSTIVNDEYYNQVYYFYSKREAMAEFREYVREELNKIIREIPANNRSQNNAR